MTQLTINIENKSLVPVLKKLLSQINGVTFVTKTIKNKPSKTPIDYLNKNQGTPQSPEFVFQNKETKMETKEFLDRFAGCWKSNLSAEQLIEEIEANKTCKDPVSFNQ